MNIAFIGVGGIAGAHMRNLARIEGVRVSAVYDVLRDRAEQAGRQYDATVAESVEALLETRPDAVYVCVPPFAHGAVELAVLERGIPLFVEKPLAVDLEPAQAILGAVQSKGLLTAVGYHWRYSEAVDAAKAALATRRAGMVMGYWMGTMPEVSWWRKMDQSGGQMVEQTTHIVDLARYLVGEIAEVHACYGNRGIADFYEGVTVPDVGSLNLRFADGAVGTVMTTCLLDRNHAVGLDIVTRDLTLEIRGDALTERGRTETRTRRNGTDPYFVEDQAFVAAVRTGDPRLVRSTYQDAYETHRVTVAANQSAQSGQPVRL